MKKLFSSKVFSVFLFVAIPLAAYFINVEVQSYFGRRAIANTGLESRSLAVSIAEAKAQDKLVLVDVSAVWCGTCRKLDNDVFSNEDVRKAIAENFVFTRLEYESEEGVEFLEKQNVNSYPSLWILDGDGRVVKRLRITFDPKVFIAQLDAAIEE